MRKKISIGGIWNLLKDSLSGISEDKIFKLSASLAYCTIFSMGPLLLMIISLTGIFYGREAIEGKIYGQLEGFVGHDTAIQLQHIIQSAAVIGKGKLAAIIGGIALLIGATSVFAEIQDSINMIWGLKPKPKKGWIKLLTNRLLSFSVIVGLGFLLLVSLAFSTIIDAFSYQLQTTYPNTAVYLFYIINLILSFLITFLIFAIVFKVLPDADIAWKDIVIGAITTAIFFMAGKFGISFYISKSHVGTTYGAAGSLVVLLLWIYYSSAILYIGAEFTKNYALTYGRPIRPSDYAVGVKQIEMESNKSLLEAAGVKP